ncbi:hypothetical protein DNTS_034454 [Danionella cerebrum]|uniref:RING-type E3 ubiquitin transferase n=1 Tax=Danionella cerebrum TaxID=2873325 RepID=A0A553PW35_9TELE|nr:hypothetical protein DNTS_034454 [Danionella translucida]
MSQRKPEERLALELSCPICLQLFKDPVALPCGHNYCQDCIKTAADLEEHQSQNRCPECREKYGCPEDLPKNFKLKSIVDGFLLATSEGGLRGDTTVPCDQCLENPVAAVKFCTRCEMTMCPGHLKRHEEVQGSLHVLMDLPSQGKRCQVHLKAKEYLCVQDRLFLCSECLMEGTHQFHEVQTFEVAKEEIKRVVKELEKTVSDKLKITETLVKFAKEEPADKAEDKLVARANVLLDNMTSLINTYKNRMSTVINDELHSLDKSRLASLCELEKCLHQLREANQCTSDILSQSSDFLFIQSYLNVDSKVRRAANIIIPSPPAQKLSDAKHFRSILRTDAFHAEMSLLLEFLYGMLNPLDLTFNPATAHSSLLLSTDLKTVKLCPGVKSNISGDPSELFVSITQIMCSQGFTTGVHMWAVELGTGCTWSVGLCYKSIPRKGDHSRLGNNSSSWKLQWKNKKLTASYDSSNVAVGQGLIVPPKKIEVNLDYEGGTLAFYNPGQGGRKQHLHTFSTVFKETKTQKMMTDLEDDSEIFFSIKVVRPGGMEILTDAVQALQDPDIHLGEKMNKKKAHLFLTRSSIDILEHKTKFMLYTCALSSVSFCAVHPNQPKILGFVARHPAADMYHCYIFQTKKFSHLLVSIIGETFNAQKQSESLQGDRDLVVEALRHKIKVLERENTELKRRLQTSEESPGDQRNNEKEPPYENTGSRSSQVRFFSEDDKTPLERNF